MDGGGEDLRQLPELALLRARNRLVAAAEAASATGLDLTEHEHPRAFDDEVELTESASPVPRDDAKPPPQVEGGGRVLAGAAQRRTRGVYRDGVHDWPTVSRPTDTQASIVGSPGMPSSRRSSSTFTSRRVITRTLETNRAGRKMSHTHASDKRTSTHPSSRCCTSTTFAR